MDAPSKTSQASSLIAKWQADPVLWAKDVLGVDVWSRQKEILESVRDHYETDVVTGNGIGKSFIAAVTILHFLFTRKDSIVLLTAPGSRQLQIVGGVIRQLYHGAKYPLGGELSPVAPELRIGPRHMFKGLTARDPSSWQGWHSPHVLVVVDECSGTDNWLDEAIMGVAVGETSRILKISNPLCGPSHFFTKSANRPNAPGKHNTIRVSSTETPNYVARREVVPGLATYEWAESMKEKYGEQSQTYRSRVLGKFPSGSPDSLITFDHIGEARSRFNADLPNPDAGEVRVGVDVARQGPDATSICVRRGNRIIFPVNGTLHKADAIAVARRAADIAQEYGALSIALDGGGLGAGPVDALRDLQRRREVPSSIDIHEVQFGARAVEHERFANRRAELWWKMRDALRDDLVYDCPDDLAEELSAPRFKHVGARIQLEAKDQIKRRIGRSTDQSDALALAIHGHESAGGQLWIDSW